MLVRRRLSYLCPSVCPSFPQVSQLTTRLQQLLVSEQAKTGTGTPSHRRASMAFSHLSQPEREEQRLAAEERSCNEDLARMRRRRDELERELEELEDEVERAVSGLRAAEGSLSGSQFSREIRRRQLIGPWSRSGRRHISHRRWKRSRAESVADSSPVPGISHRCTSMGVVIPCNPSRHHTRNPPERRSNMIFL